MHITYQASKKIRIEYIHLTLSCHIWFFFPRLQWIFSFLFVCANVAHAKWIEGIAIYIPQLIVKHFLQTQNVMLENEKNEFRDRIF